MMVIDEIRPERWLNIDGSRLKYSNAFIWPLWCSEWEWEVKRDIRKIQIVLCKTWLDNDHNNTIQNNILFIGLVYVCCKQKDKPINMQLRTVNLLSWVHVHQCYVEKRIDTTNLSYKMKQIVALFIVYKDCKIWTVWCAMMYDNSNM